MEIKMSEEFDRWDIELSEWRGYTLKALEDIGEELKEIKLNIKGNSSKIDELKTAMYNNRVKIASLSATSALIVTFVVNFLI